MPQLAPKKLLSTKEAAKHIGRAEVTLRLWRWQKNPHQPPWIRVGSRGVAYDIADLDAYLESRKSKVKPPRK